MISLKELFIQFKYEKSEDSFRKLLKENGIKIGRGKRITRYDEELLRRTIFNPLFYNKTRENLAKDYVIHPETLSIRLKEELNIVHSNRLSIVEITLIYDEWGLPESIEKRFPKHAKEFEENRNQRKIQQEQAVKKITQKFLYGNHQ